MRPPNNTKRIVTALASVAAFGVLAGAPGASNDDLPGDRSVPFWPHETGALMGTSETFVDVRADGSYYDPSIGRRVVVAAQLRK
jgi:hypothetical protein